MKEPGKAAAKEASSGMSTPLVNPGLPRGAAVAAVAAVAGEPVGDAAAVTGCCSELDFMTKRRGRTRSSPSGKPVSKRDG